MQLIRLILILSLFIDSAANAKTILFVGDSLSCGPFGKYLMQDLTNKGHQVKLYCTVSSAPENWLSGRNPPGQKCQESTSTNLNLKLCNGDGKIPKISNILTQYKNAEVLIALGTNSLMSPTVSKSYQTLTKLIKENGNSCYWIGPPHLNPSESKGFPASRLAKQEKNLNSFYSSLKNTTKDTCRLVDSRQATAADTTGNQTVDGVHRNENAGKYWASQISHQLSPRQDNQENKNKPPLAK